MGEKTTEDYNLEADARARAALDDQERLELDEKRLRKKKDILAVMKDMKAVGAAREEIDVALEQLRIDEARIVLSKEWKKLSDDDRKEKRKFWLEQEQALKAEKEGMDMAASAMKRYLGLTKDSGKMFENWGSKMKGMMKDMKETMTLGNLAGAGLQKIVESTIALALAQDEAVVSFNKSTGAAGKFNDNIRGLERRMFNYGVMTDEAAKAVESLYKNVTDYTRMSKTQQAELEDTVALLGEMGVEMNTTSKNMQFFMKVMKQGTAAAAASTRRLYSAAQNLGVSVQQLSADFEKAKGLIAALGDTGEEAFIQLQSQAKASGLSFDTLLSTVQKFDTFSSAAEHVGKLNAILGGPFLNSLEMVAETDPAERMRKLSEGIRESGVSFEEMGYYQKKAMTAAMGLNNEMELALFLSGDLEDARGPTQTTEDFKELADQTAQFQTMMDELKQFALSMAGDLGPVLETVKGIVHFFTEWGGTIKGIIMLMGALKVATLAYAAAEAAVAYFKSMSTAGVSAGLGLAGWAAIVAGGASFLGMLSMTGGGGKAAATPKKKKKLSKLAKGGPVTSSPTLVGENGPELMTGNIGNRIHPAGSFNPSTPAEGGSGGGFNGTINVTVKLGDQELKDLVQDVEVKPYVNAKKSRLHDSIVKIANPLS
jgi:methyl-accepting chemotaxis protein